MAQTLLALVALSIFITPLFQCSDKLKNKKTKSSQQKRPSVILPPTTTKPQVPAVQNEPVQPEKPQVPVEEKKVEPIVEKNMEEKTANDALTEVSKQDELTKEKELTINKDILADTKDLQLSCEQNISLDNQKASLANSQMASSNKGQQHSWSGEKDIPPKLVTVTEGSATKQKVKEVKRSKDTSEKGAVSKDKQE